METNAVIIGVGEKNNKKAFLEADEPPWRERDNENRSDWRWQLRNSITEPDKLKEIFGGIPGNLSVLEEQIDIKLQMEYFEFSKNKRDKLDAEEVINKKDNIFEQDISKEDKKSLFVQLASLENVEAYRTIERYLKTARKLDMIIFTGAAKTGGYYLTDKMKKYNK